MAQAAANAYAAKQGQQVSGCPGGNCGGSQAAAVAAPTWPAKKKVNNWSRGGLVFRRSR